VMARWHNPDMLRPVGRTQVTYGAFADVGTVYGAFQPADRVYGAFAPRLR
jgi:hypothetical protein